MASNVIKAGVFSDGGHRIRIVAPGYNADPAPTDTSKIIFDSDWPDILMTAPGYYGSTGLSTSANTTISFGALPFTPIGFTGIPVAAMPDSYVNPPPYNIMSPQLWSALANAYQLASASPTASNITLTQTRIGATGLWVVYLADPNPAAGSRVGTTWMKWSANGPVVTKAGRSISSSNVWDYLIPPSSLGVIFGQPLIAGTVTSLPYYATWTGHYGAGGGTYTAKDYVLTIPHNLGYIPFVVVAQYVDFRVATNTPATAYIDANNLYLYAQISNVQPISYYILRGRWY